jgi:hypothetical protein
LLAGLGALLIYQRQTLVVDLLEPLVPGNLLQGAIVAVAGKSMRRMPGSSVLPVPRT